DGNTRHYGYRYGLAGRYRPGEKSGNGRKTTGPAAISAPSGAQASRIAVTPWPPAAQMEIRPRTGLPVSFFFSASCLASWATMRPPVAANGWPAASDEPLTFSLDRSIEPSGASRPRRPLQYSGDSQAASV